MKKTIFATFLFVGVAFSNSAFADRWVEAVNGTVKATQGTDPWHEVDLKMQRRY